MDHNQIRVYVEVKGESAPELLKYIEDTYIIMNLAAKVVAEVPSNWAGFKNGKILEILQLFNTHVYFGIVFITERMDYIVTDFDGEKIKPFEGVFDKRKVYRYVKKRLSVANVVDSENKIFEVKRFILNLNLINPIVKVLDVYSVGSQSRITMEMFGV